MTDTMSDTYETIDPAGNVSFDFTGVINAQGLVLDEAGTATNPPAQSVNQAAWQRAGVTKEFAVGYATVPGLHVIQHELIGAFTTFAAVGVSAIVEAGTFDPVSFATLTSVRLIDDKGNSSFYQLPIVGPAPGAGTAGQALVSGGAGVNPTFQDVSYVLRRSPGPFTIGPSDATEKDLIKQANHAGNTPYQVPAGALGTSRKLRITVNGQFLANSATAANRAYTLRIYFGGNVVYAGALNPRPAQSATKYSVKWVIECDEAGTTAQQFWTIQHTIGNVTAPTTGIGLIGAGVALNDLASSAAPGTAGQTNVDTTVAQNLELTLALVSDPAVSFTLQGLTVELV